MRSFRMNDVPVVRVQDEREYVSPDDFLACYPQLNDRVKSEISYCLGQCSVEVEKRVEDSFLRLLRTHCIDCHRPPANLTPIVIRDGWVIWTPAQHPVLINSLSLLFEERIRDDRSLDEKLAVLRGEAEPQTVVPLIDERLITNGHAWYISSERPHEIQVSNQYIPTRDDKFIFDSDPFRLMYRT